MNSKNVRILRIVVEDYFYEWGVHSLEMFQKLTLMLDILSPVELFLL